MDYVVNEKGTKLIDVIYPIGSIYMSFNSTSPADLFGGTWTQITNRFLYCTTSSGATGGENSHVLAQGELPARTMISTYNDSGASKATSGIAWGSVTVASNSYVASCLYDLKSNGVNTGISYGTAHNNMPQYITCYAWYRTA